MWRPIRAPKPLSHEVADRQLALADVPFYLRTGKRMPRRATRIIISSSAALVRTVPRYVGRHLMPNQLVLHIQPEKASLCNSRQRFPPVMRLGTVDMNFEYQEYFVKQPSTGYERLLHDCRSATRPLFSTGRHVEAGMEA